MHKKLITFILLIIVPFSLSSCSKNQHNMETVNLVLDWTPNTNHTGIYVAKELGLFQENNLNVNIVQPPEDASIVLVGSGNAQFCISFQDSFAMALTSNTPVPATAVATILKHNTSGILSKKESNILSPKDLEGKMYSSWNSPIELAMLKNIVKRDLGNFEYIDIVPNSTSDAASALLSGIDAASAYYGWDVIASKVNNINTNFFRFADINPTLDFYAPIIIANNNYLKEKPEITRKFLKCLDQGYNYCIDNPIESAEILLKYNPELNRDLVIDSQMWLSTQYKAEDQYWGTIDKNRWSKYFEWLYKENLISKDLKSEGFTNDYLNLGSD